MLCWLLPLSLWSQLSEVDSLEANLKQHIAKDTAKVDLLIQLAKANAQKNLQKTIKYAQTAKTLSDSLFYKTGQIRALRMMAVYYLGKSEYTTALGFSKQALKLSENEGLPLETINTYIQIGVCHFKNGDYYKAMEIYQRALRQSENIGHEKSSMSLLSRIGSLYYFLREYDKALLYYHKSLNRAKKIGNKNQECRLLANMTVVYREQKEYAKALSYIDSAMTMARELKLKPHSLIHGYLNSAKVNAAIGNHQKAISHYRESLSLSKRVNNVKSLSESLVGLAEVHYSLGYYNLAKKHAERVLSQAKGNQLTEFKAKAYLVLAEIAALNGNYKEAHENFKNHKLFSDSLYSHDRIKKVTTLQNKYDFDKEKKLIEAAQQQNKVLQEAELNKQTFVRYVTIAAGLMLLVLAGIIFVNLQQKRRANAMLWAQKKEIERQNINLRQLDNFKRTMMGSIVHDLKTPLNTIINPNGSNLQEGLRKTKQAGRQMLSMVLNILDVYKYQEAKVPPKVANNQLLAIADNAIAEVSLLASNKMLHLQNRISPEMGVASEWDLIQRVMVNLFTNAIKSSPIGGQITIDAALKKDKVIEIRVIDKGKGIENKHLPYIFDKYSKGTASSLDNLRSTDLGLAFCKLIIEAHGGKIWVESTKGEGTTFFFTLSAVDNFKMVKRDSDYTAPKVFEKVELKDEELKIVKPYLEALAHVSVYEITKFKSVMAKLKVGSGPIAKWKKNLELSVLHLNEEHYEQLLKIDLK